MAKLSLSYRLHEWLAERVSWVQYPNVRTERKPLIVWKHQMPWTTRALLIMFGLATLVLCAIAMFFLSILFLSILTA